ncbi:putative alpha-ketoglutarate-dependent 2,4-dichlorophenoxyacetate dioxygenase [Naematelia encephala]|uniref:Putative alpha-ketoglutarate-dependent 2,4-dichlorophenoxyacetate dioxygenase n=1 Tax=Naematelia encephala TaxID=71784 RepID=A0A1Y2BKQ1_9TREE|nr:putative alpha-ketoglutarate-dependent 2,4-dichlorophenoxyacetate dioxygenase [Naematelia encephala]
MSHTLTETSTTATTSIPPTLQLRGEVGLLRVRPVVQYEGGGTFGAEVEGVDWSKPIPDDVVDQLIALEDKYAVLIFRQTGLDNDGHIAFSQQLGADLEVNPFYYGRENDRVGEPYLWDVGNIELDGSLVKPNSRRWHHSLGNTLWHTDSSYHQRRSKYSLLLSHGDPVRGGSWTHFADTRQAYTDLPEELKLQLEDLIVEHDLWHSRKLGSPVVYGNPLPHEKAAKPPAYHRLVQISPGGQKALYLAAHAKTVSGMSLEDSQKLLWKLIDHCTQPKYVFSMEWLNAGDMVWWDNRQSMHRANPYTEDMTARDVRRSTVIDDGPLAWGVPDAKSLFTTA